MHVSRVRKELSYSGFVSDRALRTKLLVELAHAHLWTNDEIHFERGLIVPHFCAQ